MRAKKRRVDEILDVVTDHFAQNNIFKLPLLRKVEQTEADLEDQTQVAGRA